VSNLRILFVDTAVDISIADSARGYLGAIKRQGHDVYHFRTSARIRFAVAALKGSGNEELTKDFSLISRMASEMIVVEALKHRADLIVVSSGLGLHQDGLELLTRAGFPIALILTESPYEDGHQERAARHCGHVFTNDLASATTHPDWHYLASAYDPEYHHPFPHDPEEDIDVLFVGTGWPERQTLLEGVNWDGINLRIMGMWPGMDEASPLWPFLFDAQVSNDETARLYSSAKIAVNHHRADPKAVSLNPRGYELGGCGVFQISDWRPEIGDVYGSTVPTYRDSAELEKAIRGALSWTPQTLKSKSIKQRERLIAGKHTFDDRAAQLISIITTSR
jgi:spore maturation protein CgeB